MPESTAGFAVFFLVEAEHAVMYLRGEADIATSQALRDAFDHLAEEIRPSSVVIDLNELAFMDVGSGYLLASYCRRAGNQGCEVTLRQAKPAILPVLDLFELQPSLV
jgi:anti-anti-sigma factor